MIMNVTAWIASRLRIGAGSSRSARTGAAIAVAGVAIALTVMEFTLAVVGGFRNEIRHKVLGFDAEVSVMPAYNPELRQADEFLQADDSLLRVVRAVLPSAHETLAMRRPAVLKTDSDFIALYFTAYDPKTHNYAFERSCVVRGEWPDYSADSARNAIVISESTARSLGLDIGDRPMLYFINNDAAIRARRTEIAAVFASRMEERDRNTAYASLPLLQAVSGVRSGWGTQLEIRGIGIDSAANAAEKLQECLVREWQDGGISHLYPVDNVGRSGGMYLNWLDLLDTNVVVIFILMLLVAASTLIAALFILVLEHISTIGILRSLGATRRMVRNVFIATAMRLVFWGMLLGNMLGIGLLLLQKHMRLIPLDPEMYYLDHVPVSLNWGNMLMLNAGVALTAWLILVVPSRVAAGIDPARTMRYE